MSHEPKNELEAHALAVLANGMPLFDEPLSMADKAAFNVALHALNTHCEWVLKKSLWTTEDESESYWRIEKIARSLASSLYRTWDGYDYDWGTYTGRFLRQLELSPVEDGYEKEVADQDKSAGEMEM